MTDEMMRPPPSRPAPVAVLFAASSGLVLPRKLEHVVLYQYPLLSCDVVVRRAGGFTESLDAGRSAPFVTTNRSAAILAALTVRAEGWWALRAGVAVL